MALQSLLWLFEVTGSTTRSRRLSQRDQPQYRVRAAKESARDITSHEQKRRKLFLDKTPSEYLDLRIPDNSGYWRRGSAHALNRTRRNSESSIPVIYWV
jgi:hypothetical protein